MQGETTQNAAPVVGVYGGTFDPVHVGHLGVATDALEAAGLDRVLWIPNRRSPLKKGVLMADDHHRWAMLEAATAGESRFGCSRIELDGPEISYSIDTLDGLSSTTPGVRYRFLLGEDSVADLHRWKEGERLVREYDPVVVARPGVGDVFAASGLSREAVEQLRAAVVELELRDVSASGVRERAAEGKSLNGLVPAVVEDYIRRHRLYRNPGGEASE